MAAAIGGVLWTVKSLTILVVGTQPDYTFEIAPFFFGVAAVGVVPAFWLVDSRPSSRRSKSAVAEPVSPTISPPWIAGVFLILAGAATASAAVHRYYPSSMFGSFLGLEQLRVLGVVGVVGLAVFGAIDLADEVDRIIAA